MPPRWTVRDAIRKIENDGWFCVAMKGSHRQYKHAAKPGRVTIAGKLSDTLSPGTWNLEQHSQAGRPEGRMTCAMQW